MTKDQRNTTASMAPGSRPSRWLLTVDKDADPAALGGKARSLQRLATLGLPTPPSFVVTDEAFRALARTEPLRARGEDNEERADEAEVLRSLEQAPWPAGFEAELGAALEAVAALAGATAFAVRSSFAHEDDASALAAGVYLSELPVAKDDVAAAVRRVWASAFSPGAHAYARRTRRPLATAPLAVLVHPYVEARALGSVAFSPAHEEAEPLVERTAGELEDSLVSRLKAGARKAAEIWGSADLEWAVPTGGAPEADLVFLQGRPDTRHDGQDDDRAWADALGAGPHEMSRPPSTWSWDAAHNPGPLTPAQEGLVAHVNEALTLPFEMRVVRGYLFYAKKPAPAARPLAEVAEAWQAWRPSFVARLEAWAARTPATHREALEDALALYREGYAMIFASLQPALAAARTALHEALRGHGLEGDTITEAVAAFLRDVPSLATRRRELARAVVLAPSAEARSAALASYLREFGEEAAAWDVASPSWRERPDELLRRLLPRDGALRVRPQPKVQEGVAKPGGVDRAPQRPPGAPSDDRQVAPPALPRSEALPAGVLANARQAVALGEDDDALFARLQHVVRGALLTLGRALTARGALDDADDVFFLAWPEQLAAAYEALERAGVTTDPGTAIRPLNAAATAGRATHARALRRPPPLAYATSSCHGARVAHDPWQGQPGAPGRIVGRVVFHDAPESESARTSSESDEPRILVAATLLPTELPLIEAEALVVETGGPLGHVASQARERGIPAVVGLAGATQLLRAGQRVLVDGDRGRLTQLEDDLP